MTALIYNGPEGQVNTEVGLALAAAAEPRDVELAGVARDVVGTDDPGGSAILEPGKVYDLPAELASRLVASSDFWQPVRDYSKLSKAQLAKLAGERNVEGRSSMTEDELVAAIRASDASPAAAPTSDVGPDPGGVPREDGGQPLADVGGPEVDPTDTTTEGSPA